MNKKKHVFKYWLSWNSEQYEAYLEQWHQKGWIVESITFGTLLIHMRKADPDEQALQTVSYCVDYQNKVGDDYYLLLQDDGWELKGKDSGWYIWCKPYKEGEVKPQLFTEKQSRYERNKRIFALMLLVAVTQLPLFIMNLKQVHLWAESTFGIFSMMVYLGVLCFFFYGAVRSYQEMTKLK